MAGVTAAMKTALIYAALATVAALPMDCEGDSCPSTEGPRAGGAMIQTANTAAEKKNAAGHWKNTRLPRARFMEEGGLEEPASLLRMQQDVYSEKGAAVQTTKIGPLKTRLVQLEQEIGKLKTRTGVLETEIMGNSDIESGGELAAPGGALLDSDALLGGVDDGDVAFAQEQPEVPAYRERVPMYRGQQAPAYRDELVPTAYEEDEDASLGYPEVPEDASLLSVASSRTGSIKGRVAAIEADVAALNSKLETLENQVAGRDFDEDISLLEKRRGGPSLKGRIVELEDAVDKMRTRVSTLEHTVMG